MKKFVQFWKFFWKNTVWDDKFIIIAPAAMLIFMFATTPEMRTIAFLLYMICMMGIFFLGIAVYTPIIGKLSKMNFKHKIPILAATCLTIAVLHVAFLHFIHDPLKQFLGA